MSIRAWARVAVAICAISICAIGFAWYREVTTYRPADAQLVDDAAVARALQQEMPARDGDEPRVLVPTGIFIQSVAFTSASDVNVTGYIWQRYSKDLRLCRANATGNATGPGAAPGGGECDQWSKYADDACDCVSIGFVLPEQVESSSTVIEEAYTRRDGDTVVIGWYVDVTLRQPFDYSKYPLDSHDVWIRMWHADFDRNVVLTPDLASYTVAGATRPGNAFGLDQDIVPGGWTIEETFFSYKPAKYDTNFGIQGYVGQTDFPELHFDIVLRRKFINAFIVNLVPLLVVLMLLFAILMTVTGDKDRSEVFGFSTSGAIGTASALFFVVMLSHIQLREAFPGAGIVYLEYFYLATYVVILLSSLDFYLFSSTGGRTGTHPRIIHYEDNLIPKLAFWPVILLGLAVITLICFR